MKIKKLLFALCVATGLIACDDETGSLGSSLTSNMDHLEIATDTFVIKTRSMVVDSVLAKSDSCFLGTVRDPETGVYLTANYMSQFHTLEDYEFPEISKITHHDDNGNIIADSCEIRIFYNTFYGDSLSSMKCTVYEMKQPMTEDKLYYSNFDPIKEGLVRSTAENGLKVSKTYTLVDMNVDEKTRNDKDYTKNIRIQLNQPYTDVNGVEYNNYGTYIMRKYYEDPSLFKSSIRLINHVMPGFYIESTGGLGSMANVILTQVNLYFTYEGESSDKPYTGTTSFSGTREVMQRTNFVTDKAANRKLAAQDDCTYIKTPAGIFTEVEFPIEDICKGHDNDTINTAKFSLQRIENNIESDYKLSVPQTLLILPKDSLYSFFEKNKVANYKYSFIATYDSSKNSYTFNNIGSLIKSMQQAKVEAEEQGKQVSEDWNKAVLVPVTTSYTTISQSSVLSAVKNNTAMTSVKLIGGQNNPHGDIKMSVIYSKYK